MDWVDAVRIRAKLKNAKIGILGFRAHGFFNLAFDELTLYKEIGVLIDHYELTDIWNQPVDDAAVEARKKQIAGLFDLSGVSGEQVQRVAELCERFKAFMDRQGLAGLAVRCWPEFAAGYGVSPLCGDVYPAERRLCHRLRRRRAGRGLPAHAYRYGGWSSPSWPTSPR